MMLHGPTLRGLETVWPSRQRQANASGFLFRNLIYDGVVAALASRSSNLLIKVLICA